MPDRPHSQKRTSPRRGRLQAYRRRVAELVVGVMGVVLSALVLWVMWQYYVNGK